MCRTIFEAIEWVMAKLSTLAICASSEHLVRRRVQAGRTRTLVANFSMPSTTSGQTRLIVCLTYKMLCARERVAALPNGRSCFIFGEIETIHSFCLKISWRQFRRLHRDSFDVIAPDDLTFVAIVVDIVAQYASNDARRDSNSR